MESKEEAVKLIELAPLLITIAMASSFFVTLPFIQQLRMMRWNYPKVIRNNKDLPLHSIRIKPFDCAPCLSFWVSLLTLTFMQECLFNIILLSFASSQISKYVQR